MIISGNKIARAIRDELEENIKGPNPSVFLHIFIIGDDPVIENFVMKKKAFAESLGVEFIEHRMVDTVENLACQTYLINDIKVTTEEYKVSQEAPSSQCGRFGMVVQLPLPRHIDMRAVLDAVPIEYDIDGLATDSEYIEPVAGAVQEILERKSIAVAGKTALVVGKGKLVGEPVARLLSELGAIVTMVDNSTDMNELTKLCKQSDVIVSGAGVPNLITPDMITKGVTLLDAGTSTQAGSVVGDIAYECKDKARYFARTPGGIGPVTVAVLFQNLLSNRIDK